MSIRGVGGNGNSRIPSHNGDGSNRRSQNTKGNNKVEDRVCSLYSSRSNENRESPYAVVDVSSMIESTPTSGETTRASRGVFSRFQRGLVRIADKVRRAVQCAWSSVSTSRSSATRAAESGSSSRTARGASSGYREYSPSAARGLRLMFTDFWRTRVLRQTSPMAGVFGNLDVNEARLMAAYTSECADHLEAKELAGPDGVAAAREIAKRWEKRVRDLQDKGAARKLLNDPLGRRTPNYQSKNPGEYTVGNSMFYDGPQVANLQNVDTGFWLDMSNLSDVVLSREIQTGLRARATLEESMPMLENLEERFRRLQESCDAARTEIEESGWTRESASRMEGDEAQGPSRAQQAFQSFVNECNSIEFSFGSFGEHVRVLCARVSRGLAAAGEAIRRCFSCCKGSTHRYAPRDDLSPEGASLAETLARFADDMGIERGADGTYDIPLVDDWRRGVPSIEGEGSDSIYEIMMPIYEVMNMDLETRRSFAVQQGHYQDPRASDYDLPRASDYDLPRSPYPTPPLPPRYQLQNMDVEAGFREAVYASFVAGMYNYVVTQPQERIPNSQQVEGILRDMLTNGSQTFRDLMKRWNREVDRE